MSNIVGYRSTSVQRREDRALDRAVGRINHNTDINIVRVQAKLEVQDAKLEAVVATIGRAAQGAARLGQLEVQLAEVVPGSSSKIGYIIDRGVLALGDIVDDTVNELRRLR
jgi:hypothetical protein